MLNFRYLIDVDSEPRRECPVLTCFFCKDQLIWDTEEITSHLVNKHATTPDNYRVFLKKIGQDIEDSDDSTAARNIL